MTEFIVRRKEIHGSDWLIKADSIAEAERAVLNGEGVLLRMEHIRTDGIIRDTCEMLSDWEA